MTRPTDKNEFVDALCERKLTRRDINKALGGRLATLGITETP